VNRRDFLRSCLATGCGLGIATAPAAAGPEPGWTPIFNGRDLDGWTPKIRGYPVGENFGDTFRVVDGLLSVAYDAYPSFDDRFGHLFFDRVLSSYRLRVEYRFVGAQVPGAPDWARRNSGVMLHGQSPDTMALDQSFPVSIEAQFLGAEGAEERSTLNLCTPGTHVRIDGSLVTTHCIDSSSATHGGDAWVRAELEVRGHERIRHLVDGVEVLAYTDPQLDPDDPDAARLLAAGHSRRLAAGTISLQSESHPIQFRSVELLRLS
jgi:hypothetical protein